ncbi:MAG: hypothetical protein ACXWXO_07570 [Nocardioides sp.]
MLRATDVVRRQGGRVASDDVGAGRPRPMDAWLVVEGVEALGQLATVVDLGVPLV